VVKKVMKKIKVMVDEKIREMKLKKKVAKVSVA